VLLVLLVGATAAPAFAQQAGASAVPVALSADHIDYDTQTGALVADGHVKATQADVTITADHLTGNLQTGLVNAQGHVTLVQGTETAAGDALTYNYRNHVGQMGNVTTKYGPWNIKSQMLDTQGNGRGTARQVSMTPCDPTHPFFHVTSDHVLIVPDDYLTAYHSSIYIYNVKVATIPQYTASLKKNRQANSGPTFGYSNLDGLFIQYNQWFPLGDVSDQLRLRYGTLTQFTAENIATLNAADHTWSLHLGREELFDTSGVLVNVDQNSLNLAYNGHPIGNLPDNYQISMNYGDYHELATGVDTNRADALAYLTSRTLQMTTELSLGAAASYEYTSYGTGVVRNMIGFSTALTQVLNQVSSLTLSYNLLNVNGIAPQGAVLNGPFTPFEFDSESPTSSVTLNYSYYPGGHNLFQSGQISLGYDFLGLQTESTMSLNFLISPTIIFTTSANYNVSQSQFTEIDYALNATCDCLSIGLLYRTFPQTPQDNTIYITLNVNTLAGASTEFQFGPTTR
jgi:lipopolysaccharide export system protein LptA